MPKREHVPTLQLTRPFGQTLWLALLMAAGLFLIGEMVLRVRAVESELPAPSVGSSHDQFEVELYRLHQFSEAGPIDCIFLGSSMVWYGINPHVFNEAYTARTGDSLRCFTFGVAGLTADGAGALADYLVDTYQPRLLVYGVSPRDFSNPIDERADFSQLDWLQYVRGSFNLSGYLHDQAKTIQYGWYISEWVIDRTPSRLEKRRLLADDMTENGYTPSLRKLSDIRDIEREIERITLLYEEYEPVQNALAGIRHIIAYHDPPDTQIVLVELPLYPPVVSRLVGEQTYQDFNTDILSLTETNGVLYWPTTHLNLVPKAGWGDLNHLNETGAAIFSEWLGRQIAEAVQNGQLQPVARDG
jgi:hypothetical protein